MKILLRVSRILILLMIFSLGIIFPLFGQQNNPFISGERREPVAEKQENLLLKPERTLTSLLSPLLRNLNQTLAGLTRDLGEELDYRKLLLLLSISCLYGIIHAAGPGHGKTVIVSYFLAVPGTLLKALFAGILIAVIHAASASIIVILLSLILKTLFSSSFETASRIIQIISYILIMLLGINGLVFAALEKIKRGSLKIQRKPGSLPLLCLAAGIIPCPGAVALLIFSLPAGLLHLGFLSVSAMSLGMATTISLAGMTAVLTKDGVLALTKNRYSGLSKTGGKVRTDIVRTVLEFSGFILLTLLGLAMLLSVFQ